MSTFFQTNTNPDNIVINKTKKPKMYKVLMFNDDFTTMEFVIDALVNIFNKSFKEAERVMLDVHERGIGTAGIYPYDIAVTKASTAIDLAKEEGFPFRMEVKEE